MQRPNKTASLYHYKQFWKSLRQFFVNLIMFDTYFHLHIKKLVDKDKDQYKKQQYEFSEERRPRWTLDAQMKERCEKSV